MCEFCVWLTVVFIDWESGFHEYILKIHEFYLILKIPSEFYFEIQYS